MEYTYTEKLFVAYLEFQFNWVSCFYGVIVYCVCVCVCLFACFAQSVCPSPNSADHCSSFHHLILALNAHLTGMLGGFKEKCVERALQTPKNYKIK